MNSCQSNCNEVTLEEEGIGSHKSWKPFMRQLTICSGVWTSYFLYGLCVGAPTVFIPQIRREANSTGAVSDEMASWLSSAFAFSASPCVVIIAILAKLIGRKITYMIACVSILIALLVFYFSTTVTEIFISLIIEGVYTAAEVIIPTFILTEYTSPKYRSIFLPIKIATFQWGIWASNAIGTFFHWKNIGLVGIGCALYVSATVLMVWPESPYWLASKGRYEECRASHRWLKGSDDESEKELENLIKTEKEYLKDKQENIHTFREKISFCYTMITSKEFYKPTLISILTLTFIFACGKFVCAVYAIDIIKKITDSESSAYTGMLILDGATVASMYLGCILMKFFNRRSLLFISSSFGIIFLCMISLYLYLIHLLIISENVYVSICLLTLFSISISCGPMMMSASLYVELIPLRSRNLSVCVIALSGKLCLSVNLKIAHFIFKTFAMHGTFLFFGITSFVWIVLLYKYLPETKDKTLQEITDSMTGVTRINKEPLKEAEMLLVSQNHTKK